MAVQLQQVSFGYDDQPILEQVTLAFPEKGVVCLYGHSGCGKTTILRLLAGLERPDEGRITGLEGKRTTVVFQEDRLLPWLTALENVAVPLIGEEAHSRAMEVLRRVGLESAANQHPDQLSGGMKRRVAIARALAANGDVLLLDEPFTGLDDGLRRELAQAITKQYADRLVVLVTHIEEEAAWMGADILRLPPAPLKGTLHFEKLGF